MKDADPKKIVNSFTEFIENLEEEYNDYED
jgi:hypothetical protein